MRRLLSELLRADGLKVQEATREREVLQALREGEGADVLVCPAPPPGTKHSLVGQVRNTVSPGLAVICLSHENGLADRAQAFELGASDYLLRPVSTTGLPRLAREWARRGHRKI